MLHWFNTCKHLKLYYVIPRVFSIRSRIVLIEMPLHSRMRCSTTRCGTTRRIISSSTVHTINIDWMFCKGLSVHRRGNKGNCYLLTLSAWKTTRRNKLIQIRQNTRDANFYHNQSFCNYVMGKSLLHFSVLMFLRLAFQLNKTTVPVLLLFVVI